MIYPYIGITGIWPEYEPWGAKEIEQALRDGHHIYFEDFGSQVVALFKDGKFKLFIIPYEDDGPARFESKSFLEFAAWIAFYGRDIL